MATMAGSTTVASIPRKLGRAGGSARCSTTRGARGWRSYDQMVNSSPAASLLAAADGGAARPGEQGHEAEGKVVHKDRLLTVKT